MTQLGTLEDSKLLTDDDTIAEFLADGRRDENPDVFLRALQEVAMMETAFLLRSPANAKRLIKSINSLRSGKAEARQLIE
ncbi:prevent-host-death protein [Pseudomonas akapageensis]|uniref:prevent-host-death protein n=1 Tax=Pseudomonas akapageensis TaxID=2609961 RepID=UPI001FE7B49B|nr:prevent-host-death protein [Pseudomonas akapageensis]